MLNILTVPILNDNYAFILQDTETGTVAVVDPGEAGPVIKVLQEKGWQLDMILNTHHHGDHTDGNAELLNAYNATLIAPAGENRIENVDTYVSAEDVVSVGASQAAVMETPGHTRHHISFWFQDDHALFCGDTLFAVGCGRVFEGTAEDMFYSLQKIKALPDDTTVYCAHEYTLANIKFAETVISDNETFRNYAVKAQELRHARQPTIPTHLGREKIINPFLLAQTPAEFAEYRAKKDSF